MSKTHDFKGAKVRHEFSGDSTGKQKTGPKKMGGVQSKAKAAPAIPNRGATRHSKGGKRGY